MDSAQEGVVVRRVVLAAALVCACGLDAAETLGHSVDATGAPIGLQPSSDAAVLGGLLQPVGLTRDGGGARRFYVAGIIGDSFATLATPLGPDGEVPGDPSPSPAANQSLFTAGGALGLAFDALDRAWRVEFEGRGRNNLVSSRISTFDAIDGLEQYQFTTAAKNGWSTMVNLWRDYELSDRWAVYAGGGIGAGGYRFSYVKLNPANDYQISGSHAVSAFAWQAGGGTAWAVTDRITLDVGYRFFQIANTTTTAVISYAPGPPVGSEVVGSAFSASELFLAVRIAEPFRSWR